MTESLLLFVVCCAAGRDFYAEDGSLRPTAATAEALLLQALKLQPHHLHALHLHIHSEWQAAVSTVCIQCLLLPTSHQSTTSGLACCDAMNPVHHTQAPVAWFSLCVPCALHTNLLVKLTHNTLSTPSSDDATGRNMCVCLRAGAVAEAGQPAPQPGQEHTAAARALGTAETLAGLLPQNGHLLHMPSHIFVRTGRYAQAVAVNRAAYEHDLARGSQCVTPYLPEHNVNLLVYAARWGWAGPWAAGLLDLVARQELLFWLLGAAGWSAPCIAAVRVEWAA